MSFAEMMKFLLFMFLMYNLYTGKTWQIKIQELQDKLKEKDCYGVVVAALDEVACNSVIYLLVH